jgi:hypothetical protein
VNPHLSADQLFDFYRRNGICEAALGRERAARILDFPHLIVGAFDGKELIGLARATFDGLSAHVIEFSLDLRWQGQTRRRNGSLIEADPRGLGRALGDRLLAELDRQGCTFVTGYIVKDCEERFYESLGFRENVGHSVFCIDKRPCAGGG